MHCRGLLARAGLLLTALALAPLWFRPGSAEPTPIPAPAEAFRQAWKVPAFYRKHLNAAGLPILSSDKVSDYALREAAFLTDQMLAHRPEIRRAMVENRVRLVVMAPDEFTTDVPEHSDLTPKDYWDRRARGLGASPQRPVVSCGEENLLGYKGDPYRTENILIHEFAHAIHQMGMSRVDPTFDVRLMKAFEDAMAAGKWKGKYAATNRFEYFAEGVQSWYDTNRENDHDHNHVNTREELKEYDPGLAARVAEVVGESPWRYLHPAQRKDAPHLAGYDPENAPTFAWPARLRNADLKQPR